MLQHGTSVKIICHFCEDDTILCCQRDGTKEKTYEKEMQIMLASYLEGRARGDIH